MRQSAKYAAITYSRFSDMPTCLLSGTWNHANVICQPCVLYNSPVSNEYVSIHCCYCFWEISQKILNQRDSGSFWVV